MVDSYVIPESHQGKKDLLWINFKARELIGQSSYARGDGSILHGEELGSGKFLAPKEIQESVSHEGEPYDSISTRIAQKIGDVKKVVRELKGLGKAANVGYNEIKEMAGGDKNISTRQLLNKVITTAATTETTPYRIDTSLVYQGTKRREYTFNFHLAFTGKDKSSYDAVFNPIRKLEEVSCAELDTGLVNIKFPAVFNVYSEPSDIIKINNCAITSIMPTGTAPFKDGYPIYCELQITVVDLEPLYRKSFSEGGIISVVDESGFNL